MMSEILEVCVLDNIMNLCGSSNYIVHNYIITILYFLVLFSYLVYASYRIKLTTGVLHSSHGKTCNTRKIKY